MTQRFLNIYDFIKTLFLKRLIGSNGQHPNNFLQLLKWFTPVELLYLCKEVSTKNTAMVNN